MNLSKTMRLAIDRMKTGETISAEAWSGLYWGDIDEHRYVHEFNGNTIKSLEARGLIHYEVKVKRNDEGAIQRVHRVYTLTEAGRNA